MRKIFSQYTNGSIIISTLIVLLLIFPSHAFALEDDRNDDKFYKVVPKLICEILELQNCDTRQPDQNQPPVLYPTPEILQTPVPAKPGSCAQPGGKYLCGSRAYPIAGCGHCGLGYPPSQQRANCDNGKDELWGTAYAIDISLKPYQPILLPSIEGQNVEWTFYAERKYSDNAIQRYRGIANGKTYVVQFHHTLIGSSVGIGKKAVSGQIGAKLCPTCDHAHIQMLQGNGWKSATSFYCIK